LDFAPAKRDKSASAHDRFLPNPMTSKLIELLHRRIAIIADHVWRDRDATGHLEALKQVSEEISGWTAAHRTSVDARLRHYLGNASYQKALAHLEAADGRSSRF
jgi:hypothetical protein